MTKNVLCEQGFKMGNKKEKSLWIDPSIKPKYSGDGGITVFVLTVSDIPTTAWYHKEYEFSISSDQLSGEPIKGWMYVPKF